MIKEEGVLSLYKGWSVHTLGVIFWMSVLPILTDFMMEKLPLYIDPSKMPQIEQKEQEDEEIVYRFDDEEDDDDF